MALHFGDYNGSSGIMFSISFLLISRMLFLYYESILFGCFLVRNFWPRVIFGVVTCLASQSCELCGPSCRPRYSKWVGVKPHYTIRLKKACLIITNTQKWSPVITSQAYYKNNLPTSISYFFLKLFFFKLTSLIVRMSPLPYTRILVFVNKGNL